MLNYRSFYLILLLTFISHSLLSAHCPGNRSDSFSESHDKARVKRADYVIVGLGTAGAVLARKLSNDKKTSVIALHSGENLTQDPEIKFSRNALTTVLSVLAGSSFYETGMTIPQLNVDNRELLWAIGLPEGGDSSINAGMWARGTNEVYAQWEAVAGPEWSVNRIENIYKKLENYHGKTTNPAARGFHGPVDIRQVQANEVGKKFNQAVIEATGFPYVLDYNNPQTPIGSSDRYQNTQKGRNGRLRVSSATAFLNENVITPDGRGVNGRKLRVLFNSMTLKTIWNNNKAIGVEYLSKNGQLQQVYANKAVIVCCGLRSSTFLLHSGVGPRPLLESLDIPVVFDNPNVGQNLADQTLVPMLYTTNPKDFPKIEPNSVFSQISWLPAPGGDPNIRKFQFISMNLFPGLSAVLFELAQPKSRGNIIIDSPDPTAPPVINIGMFSNPEDLELYIQGFQVYIKNINQALKLVDPLYQLIIPDPAIIDDTELLTAFIKEIVFSYQCFQSHCRMAPLNQGGVVNSQGYVYGVENLIVADDSVVPVAMDGTPMASAYLIAYNIAQMLINK